MKSPAMGGVEMKQKIDEPSLFFMNFQGELLSFILDTKMQMVSETDEGVHSSETPLTIQAFLIDEDEQYYYLGNVPPNLDKIVVDRAIAKSRVIYVQTIVPDDPFTAILDEMEKPDKEGFN